MTPEERIKAAASVLQFDSHLSYESTARAVLIAAYPEDFPPKPKWPDLFAEKLYKDAENDDFGWGEQQRALSYNAGVDDALKEVYPIIKAAVECRDEWKKGDGWRNQYPKIVDRVNEAGL